MHYCEASQGRVFILSLDDGDMIPGVIEKFAEEKRVQRGYCMLLGGAQKGSKIVVGPVNEASRPVVPLVHELEGVHEVMGIGTIFPDEEGRPTLHMHVSAGRNGKASTGCSRTGVKAWQLSEVVVVELLETEACRKNDTEIGFPKLFV